VPSGRIDSNWNFKQNRKYNVLFIKDVLYLLENTFDRKRISAKPSSNPNVSGLKKMTSFFEKVYRYHLSIDIRRSI